ncbi:MAG: hypothetical protein ACLFV5_07845 [Anaerolineales bacterium]
MSLGVAVLGPEGVVLAADSRLTLTAHRPDGTQLPVNFDSATKLLSFSKPHNYVGAVTYGAAVIGLRSAHSFMPEFEVNLEDSRRLCVEEYAKKLSEFFLNQWEETTPKNYTGPSMVFIVGGFDPKEAYGRVFVVDVPNNPEPVERNPGDTEFGMTWGGDLQIASRLIHGYDPQLLSILQRELDLGERIDQIQSILRENLEFRIPYQVMPLQDCVDLATFMIESTISAQNLSVGVRGVGGPIDVAVITRTRGLQYIQRKSLYVHSQQSKERGLTDEPCESD